MPRWKMLISAVLLFLACVFLSGCSGLDDLRVANGYPFPIHLRHKNGKEIGTVPARSTCTFSGAGGFGGDAINGTRFEDEKGKRLGTLDKDGPNVVRGEGRFNGSVTWNVTVGPVGVLPPIDFEPSVLQWVGGGVFLLILRLAVIKGKMPTSQTKPG